MVDHDPAALRDRPDRRLAPMAGRLVDIVPFRSLASVATAAGRRRAASRWPSPSRCGRSTPSSSSCRRARSSPGPPGSHSSRRSPSPTRSGAPSARRRRCARSPQSPPLPSRAAGRGWFGYAAPLLVDAGTFLVSRGGDRNPGDAPARRRHRGALRGRSAPRDFSLREDALLWPLWSGSARSCSAARGDERGRGLSATRDPRRGHGRVRLVAAVLAVGVVAGSLFAGRNAPDGVRAVRTAVAALVLALMLSVAGLAPVVWVFAVAWAFVGVPTASPTLT